MKKMMRRSLCLVLCLLMVLGMFPAAVHAAGNKVVEEVKLSATTVYCPGDVIVSVKLAEEYTVVGYGWVEFYCEETDQYIGAELMGDFDPMVGMVPYPDGSLRGGLYFGWNHEPGTYKLYCVEYYDDEGEIHFLTDDQEKYPGAQPLPNDLKSVKLEVKNNNPADHDAPVLKNVTLSATNVKAPGEVEITVDATDAVSGLLYGIASFRCEEAERSVYAELTCVDGKLRGFVNLPWNIDVGTYVLENVELNDKAGNWANYYNGDSEYSKPMPDALRNVKLVVTESKMDNDAPVLYNVTLSSSSAAFPDVVEVIVDAWDASSGVAYAEVGFYCEETGQEIYVMLDTDDYYDYETGKWVPYADGKLHGTAKIYEHLEAGTYVLDYVYLQDNVWNDCGYQRGESDWADPLPANLMSIKLVVNKAKSGWVSSGSKWYYYKNGVKLTSQWLQDAGKWYYLDASGAMTTGWLNQGGKWYYMDASGIMQTGWLKLGSNWYYLNESGVMVTGTVTIEGKQHQFNASGVWQGEITKSGWVQEDGKWCFYKNGAKVTGWLQDGSKWYYFDANGVMLTGWVKISGVWYYLQPSGAMATGWNLINGSYYYFYSSGVMKTGWLNSGGKRYFFRPDGAMATGWVEYAGNWYYMNESGAMVTGTYPIKGPQYTFDSHGVWIP